MEEKNHFYPIYINLLNKHCLVVGGGAVAQRKVENLLEYKASISLVSPQITPDIMRYADLGLLKINERNFEPQDLENVFMVFVATSNSETNHLIAKLCTERQILVNAVDDPPNCDFYVPAIIRRGSLAIAVSTEGKSPMLAGRIREELENRYTSEYSEYVDLLGEYREFVKNNIADIKIRKRVFKEIIDLDIIDMLRAGEREKVRELVEQCISSWQD